MYILQARSECVYIYTNTNSGSLMQLGEVSGCVLFEVLSCVVGRAKSWTFGKTEVN